MFQLFWDRVAAAEQDANPFRTGIVQIVMVADTDEEARRLYEKHVQYFFQRCAHIYPGFLEAPGYKSVESLRADRLGTAPRIIGPVPGQRGLSAASAGSDPWGRLGRARSGWAQVVSSGNE